MYGTLICEGTLENKIYFHGADNTKQGSISFYNPESVPVFTHCQFENLAGSEEVYDDYGYYLGDIDADFSIMPVIVGASYLMGNKWKLELGGGISYWMVSGKLSWGDVESDEEDAALMTFYGVGGFRYQNPLGGITARAGLSYLMIEDVGAAWPHISLGYGF